MDEKLEKYIRSVALPVGSTLGDLKVKDIIGVGSNGIVYEAYDIATQRVIALKEYFPVRLAKRNNDLTVEPSNEEYKAAFLAGLKTFLDSGIQLSRLRHANIVQMLKVEEQNNTVYLLMEKVEGPLLSDRLGTDHFISPEIINDWIEKILGAIKYIHDNGVLHLAIDPGNIIINDRLGPVLIDFGQLPQEHNLDESVRDNPYRAVELTTGSRDQVGKHTDIYAAGAIFSHLISGAAPVPASSRSTAKTDPQTLLAGNSKLKKSYSNNLLESIDTALAIRPESRFSNIDDWVNSISEQAVNKTKNKKKHTIGVFVILAALVIAWLTYGRNYYAEYKLWNAIPKDQPCFAADYLSEYENGRYAEQAKTRIALCEERRNAALEQEQREKKKTIDAIVGPMATISPACFEMGSPSNENGRSDNERQHEVCIDKPYELALYEVTVGQFKKFIEETQYKTDAERNQENEGCWALDPNDEDPWEFKSWASWENPYKNHPITDLFPVVCVSPNDVNQFFNWLNSIGDTNFRLPTEAEWEYAVRGKSDSIARPWGGGEEDACKFANIADLTNDSSLTGDFSGSSPWPSYHSCEDNFLYAGPVGKFKPNHNGFFDLIGNVWELTCSTYSGSYGGLESECAADEENRADRGGGWESDPDNARSATRGDIPFYARASNIGFRIAKDK